MKEKTINFLYSLRPLFDEAIEKSNKMIMKSAEDQADASIVMSILGSFSFIMVMFDSESNFAIKALSLLKNLISGVELLTLLSFVATSFLLIGCTIRCLEISAKGMQDYEISLRICNTGINGFSAFMIPVASMLTVLGLIMLLSVIYLPQSIITSQKISYHLAILLMFLPTIVVLLFIWFLSILGSIANLVKSMCIAIPYLILFFISWFSSLAQFIK